MWQCAKCGTQVDDDAWVDCWKCGANRAPEEALVPVFMPSLASILLHHEKKKGAPLTEDEALAIRDRATVVMSPVSVAREVEAKRGYRDVEPEFCWLEWCSLRLTLANEEKA